MPLFSTMNALKPCRALVLGDLMLDLYTVGKVKRISPEAPVSVLHVEKEFTLPGGAGNVMLNLRALGVKVYALGRVGRDAAGAEICRALESEGIHVSGILEDPSYSTPRKNRLLALQQQLMRIDYESPSPLPPSLENLLLDRIADLLHLIDVIAVSDYAKGSITYSLMSSLVELAAPYQIPIIADPKGVDFSKYRGVSLLKPNLNEALNAAGFGSEISLDAAAEKILEATQVKSLLITRSEEGMSLFERGVRHDVPAVMREVKDVTGAGDTVLAVMTLALGSRLSALEGAKLANMAAGIAIERVGCAKISLSELAHRLFKSHTLHKVFSEEHLFALREALRAHPFTLLGVSSQEGFSSRLFQGIQALAQQKGEELVLYISDESPDSEFVKLLASLSEVDFIILKSGDLAALCSEIAPTRIFCFKESMTACDKIEELLQTDRVSALC